MSDKISGEPKVGSQLDGSVLKSPMEFETGDVFSVKRNGLLDGCRTFVLIRMRPSVSSPYKQERRLGESFVTARNCETGEIERFGVLDNHKYRVLKQNDQNQRRA